MNVSLVERQYKTRSARNQKDRKREREAQNNGSGVRVRDGGMHVEGTRYSLYEWGTTRWTWLELSDSAQSGNKTLAVQLGECCV